MDNDNNNNNNININDNNNNNSGCIGSGLDISNKIDNVKKLSAAEAIALNYNKRYYDKIYLEKGKSYQRFGRVNNDVIRTVDNEENNKNNEVIFTNGLTTKDVTPLLKKYPTHSELSNLLKRASDTVNVPVEYRKQNRVFFFFAFLISVYFLSS
jgi:hypothetical protein